MIVCSCARVSDHDIELALLDILNEPEAPIPTPGIVYRHLAKRMNCCGCAPLAVDVIYAKLEVLEKKGLVCPYRCLSTREQLQRRELLRKTSSTNVTASDACECGRSETGKCEAPKAEGTDCTGMSIERPAASLVAPLASGRHSV